MGRGMEGNQKSLFDKNIQLQAEKDDEFHSVCINTVCAWLAWDFTTGLTAGTEQQVWHSGLHAGDPFTFTAHSLHPGLVEQFSAAPVPQNTFQKVYPNFPKDV